MRDLSVIRKFGKRGHIESGLRLDMGERALDFPKDVFQDFLNSLSQEDFICYPSESDYNSLTEKISQLNNVPSSFVNLNFGSDQSIRNIFELCAASGGEVVINDPCFPMYKVYADTFNLKCEAVHYNADLDFDLTTMLRKVNDKTNMVILANPNSPFGKVKPISDIVFLCRELQRKNITLLLDEAYIDFGGESATSLLGIYSNLIICKTFSKAWGAAGVRCGYTLSQPLNILQLEKIRPSFPTTGASLKYLTFLLDRPYLKQNYVKEVLEEKNKIIKTLDSRFSFHYGAVSWIHLNDVDDNFSLDKLLQTHNISYKNGLRIPYDNRKNWIRIGIKPGISHLLNQCEF